MTTEVITFPGIASRPSKAQRESARTRFPPRPVATDWPATRQQRGPAWQRLTSGMFVLRQRQQPGAARARVGLAAGLAGRPAGPDVAAALDGQRRRRSGWRVAAGADRLAAGAWAGVAAWLWHELSGALVVAICADLVRPSLGWLVAGAAGKGALTRNLARHRDPQGFARLIATVRRRPSGVGLRRKSHAAAQR